MMRKMLLLAGASVMMTGFGFATAPASAAVSAPVSGLAGAAPVENVRMMRKRSRMNSNASNPSRRGRAQNKGGTTGGPRY